MKKSRTLLLIFTIIILIVLDLFGDKILSGDLSGLSFIILNFRLPRLLIVLIAGVAISISGALVQNISLNPLADSGMLGFTSGASFAIVLLIFISEKFTMPSWTTYLYPACAVIGACLAYFLLSGLAMGKNFSQLRLILSGLAITAIFQSLITILQLTLNSFDFQKLAIWLTGDVWLTDYKYIIFLTICLVFGLLALSFFFNRLDGLALGQELATSLGIDVEKTIKQLFFLTLIFTSIGVAAVGAVSFVGLISPHIARSLTSFKARNRLFYTGLVGVIIMLLADIIAKNIILPSTLPLGFVVALIGAPYFVFLINRKV